MVDTQLSLPAPPAGSPLPADPLATAVACGPALTVVFEDRARRREQRRVVAGWAPAGPAPAADAGPVAALERLDPASGVLAATVYTVPVDGALSAGSGPLALDIDGAGIPAEPLVAVAGDPSGQGRGVAVGAVQFTIGAGPRARLAAGGPATLRAGRLGTADLSASLPAELCRRLAAECGPAPG